MIDPLRQVEVESIAILAGSILSILVPWQTNISTLTFSKLSLGK